MKKINIHPGEILSEEFLIPLDISLNKLARDTGTTAIRMSEIVRGKRAITADTALRLGEYFSLPPQFWLNLQSHFDLQKEMQSKSRAIITPYTTHSRKALAV